MAIYKNSHGRTGEEIDELLEKAGTALQPDEAARLAGDNIWTRSNTFHYAPQHRVGRPSGNLSTPTISGNDGQLHHIALTEHADITVALLTGQSVLVRVEHGDLFTVSWSADIHWVGNAPPVLTSHDVLFFWKDMDTTRVWGMYKGSLAP
jgi:hypothetical protein